MSGRTPEEMAQRRQEIEGLLGMFHSPDRAQARRARLAFLFLIPFEDAVNAEMTSPHNISAEAIGDVAIILGGAVNFAIDHCVVRGMPRAEARRQLLAIIAAKLDDIDEKRQAAGEVPLPVNSSFDFRTMLAGE